MKEIERDSIIDLVFRSSNEKNRDKIKKKNKTKRIRDREACMQNEKQKN